MRRLARTLAGLAIVAVLAAIIWPFVSRPHLIPFGAPPSPLKYKVIVIDPGHGGIDPGTHDDAGFTEKEVVLDIALRLRDLLRQQGAKATVTREGDHDLSGVAPMNYNRLSKDLQGRVNIIEQLRPDFFVSIHINSSANTEAAGAMAFYTPDIPDSKRLAWVLQDEMDQLIPPNKALLRVRGPDPIEGDCYYLLNSTTRPGVIMEIGFMTNAEERARFKTDDYRQQVAETLMAGMIKFAKGEGPQPEPEQKLPTPNRPTTKPGEVLVYFPTPGDNGLVWQAEKRTVPNVDVPASTQSDINIEKMAQKALEDLVAGPSKPPADTPIPPRTRVRVRLVDGTAYVNFSEAIQDIDSAWRETLAVESIRKTLGQFDKIKQVQILINEEKVATLAGHVRVDQPLDLRTTNR